MWLFVGSQEGRTTSLYLVIINEVYSINQQFFNSFGVDQIPTDATTSEKLNSIQNVPYHYKKNLCVYDNEYSTDQSFMNTRTPGNLPSRLIRLLKILASGVYSPFRQYQQIRRSQIYLFLKIHSSRIFTCKILSYIQKSEEPIDLKIILYHPLRYTGGRRCFMNKKST